MIHIEQNNLKVLKAKKNFIDKMTMLLLNRIDNLHTVTGINHHFVSRFFEININNIIVELLGETPEKIYDIHSHLKPFIEASEDIKKGVKYVFNYKWFTDKCVGRYDAYNLADDLQITTCLYCNRNYTNTIITRSGEKILRPQFDHYFDKSSCPILALSFFNLIPSCVNCNSNIKHGVEFSLLTHIHPYIDNIIDEFRFTYDYCTDSSNGLKILLVNTTGTKLERTFNDMRVETVYNSHIDQLKDLLDLRYKFSDRYLSIISSKILPQFSLTQKELYRLAFGTELEEKDFINRPLSKFKKDILKELTIIT